MSTISCTIGGTPVTIMNGAFQIVDGHEIRSTLQLTVIDTLGVLSFSRGMPVVFSDSVTGQVFIGTLSNSSPEKPSPSSPLLLHTISVVDTQYNVDKRVNTKNYTNVYAGDIVADAIDSTLYAEGITAPYSRRHDSQVSDWNQGTAVNTISIQSTSASVGDGELDLAPSGVDFVYTEKVTADFATGSLTNLVAANNTLTPTTTKAIKMVSTLNSGNVGNTITSMKIWAGSVSISAPIYLNYDIFIDPSSPQACASLNVFFSDGTNLAVLATAINGGNDGQHFGADASNDLTGLATIGWYAHGMAIGIVGTKTAVSASLDIAGTSPGTYTAYIRNATFSNGLLPGGTVTGTIFSTTLNVNPPQQLQNYGYIDTTVTVVDAYDLYSYPTDDLYDTAKAWRQGASISIGSVKLLKSSYISWTELQPDKTSLAIYYSIGGTNYLIRCINNAPLPDLPAGIDLTGKSLDFDFEFFALAGANPEVTPILESLTLNLYTSYVQTKTDISVIYDTQTLWNTGTLTNLVANSSNEITMNGVIRNWDNGDFSNQAMTSSAGAGTSLNTANNRALLLWNIFPTSECTSKQTWASTWQNFIAEVDVKVPVSTAQASMTYRQTNFGNSADSYAYNFGIIDTIFQFGRGSNSTGGGSFVSLSGTSVTYKVGAWHRLKAVVSSNSHKLYVDDVQMASVSDSTYTAAGYFGLRCYNPTGNTVDCSFDNFGVVTSLSGTWVSPGTTLTSAGTYGSSVISWRDKSQLYNGGSNTTILVEASYDNGVTYTTCTNGSPLPTITAGTSLSGKILKIRVTLSSTSAASLSAMDNLVVRVLGSYGTVTGTRSTVPIVNDYPAIVRSVGSGWGTAFDGQSWVQVGTGTTSVSGGEEFITNTTGDVHMVPGANTWTDEDATTQMKLSASTMQGGLELRYTDANNYYRLAISTTAISIIKRRSSVTTTIVTQAATYVAGTEYSVRFRVVGSSPVLLYGRTWLTGTTEPTTWTITGSG